MASAAAVSMEERGAWTWHGVLSWSPSREVAENTDRQRAADGAQDAANVITIMFSSETWTRRYVCRFALVSCAFRAPNV